MRVSSKFLSIDETLYSYRRNIGMKQYNLQKSAKYWLLLRSICDSSVDFCYFTLPCARKPDERDGKGMMNTQSIWLKDLQIKMMFREEMLTWKDFFTGVSIAKWRLEEGTSLVGTMRHDKKISLWYNLYRHNFVEIVWEWSQTSIQRNEKENLNTKVNAKCYKCYLKKTYQCHL